MNEYRLFLSKKN